jgi:NhaP-type Na+/H+ or K+/H+ antiporter
MKIIGLLICIIGVAFSLYAFNMEVDSLELKNNRQIIFLLAISFLTLGLIVTCLGIYKPKKSNS